MEFIAILIRGFSCLHLTEYDFFAQSKSKSVIIFMNQFD